MEPKKPVCAVIKSGQSYTGKQALTYFAGVSAENTGSRGICMHLLTIPPGGRAKAHLHENHETAIYVLSGEGGMWYGEKLAEHAVAKAGDFVYIPAGVPHLPYNCSETEPCLAVVARTDPNEQESVVLLPELDSLP
ncbi:MAG TPA: cupin domain-containing protein [Anaerolineae bacterium]|nr:cupin domain-containing protein [Anaerolineae bacterium]HMR65622.1 cupin domain-containing protein [Anaerolineae bacterium]